MKKLILSLAMLVATSLAQAAGYTPVDTPQSPRTDDGRIEVEAVFWYGCPFCYQLEPAVQAMKQSLPEDVEIIQVPAPLSPAWAVHARAHYMAKALGILDQVHQPMFDMLHETHGRGLTELDQLAQFFAGYGVAPEKTMAMADDERVMNALRADYERLSAYGLREVPALIVDGKFLVTARNAGGLREMVEQTQELIEKARKEKASQL
jgi:thiol:disulfide interchange protein DsbA